MAGDETTDYEDLTGMQLTDDELRDLVGRGGECVFNWTTREGYPVGVVVAYLYRDGTFFATCAERLRKRHRVPDRKVRSTLASSDWLRPSSGASGRAPPSIRC